MSGKIETPELDKMKAARVDSYVLSEFLDWLEANNMAIYTVDEDGHGIMWTSGYEKLLADYFEIDLKKVEEERRVILEAHRKEHGL